MFFQYDIDAILGKKGMMFSLLESGKVYDYNQTDAMPSDSTA